MTNKFSRVRNDHKPMATCYLVSILVLELLIGTGSSGESVRGSKKPFTVADEIGLTLFGEPKGGTPEVSFSPDGKYFAVWTERGRLDLNRPEDSLRFYRSQDVQTFLKHPDEPQPPSPIWVVNHSAGKEGRMISNWRWLADSSGVAFLNRMAGGTQRLVLADLRKKRIEPLTSIKEAVKAFDIHNRRNYVYTVADPTEYENRQAQRQGPAIVGTGHPFYELVLPDNPVVATVFSARSNLFAVIDGRRSEVKNNDASFAFVGADLALSPDGRSVITTLPFLEVPQSWETLYLPPFATSPYRLHAGHLNMESGSGSVTQYVRIDLKTGSIQALTEAPTSNTAGWPVIGGPSWSSDSQDIVLPGTFLNTKDRAPSRPCVAVIDLSLNERTCVELLKGHTETGVEEGYHIVKNTRFLGGNKQSIIVSFYNRDWSLGSTEYRHTAGGTWQMARQIEGELQDARDGFEIKVKQTFNEAPLLVAANKLISRVIWNPNPQLSNLDLGEASVYMWKDKQGRDWKGGLYKPSSYESGTRYPLVIQTHSFVESEFRPSGAYPTAFAARALAAAGIIVLQVDEHCPAATPAEGQCAVSGYEAAAKQLISEGLVDEQRIGIIGFSRTCFYVMETLTTSRLHLRAASITDGVMENYLQYMLFYVDSYPEADSIVGAKPFGDGLQEWLKRSPGFNLDKIKTPLLVAGEGPLSLLGMWEPYAGLRYQHKPVDLLMLNTDEHVLTNPLERMASQGGTIDWFRFWLQDYENPDLTKAEQYKRWRGLRRLQEESDKK
jgi:dipeptidyl aminopeptidase/acylaminoacyl peptidase